MLAVAGGKGGCGKTTTALGLASALARVGADPIVADADRDAPDLHLLAGTEAHPVEVVPAPPGPLSDGRFHAVLTELAARDRSVVVDCPAGAGRDAVVPLRASDAALLATTLHPSSLRDAAKTAAIADRLGVDLVGVVLTRVPAWALRSGDDAGCASDSARGPVQEGVVRRVERLLDASVVGWVPAVDRSGRAVLAHPDVRTSYERLARVVRR